jgi:hypothetical protein
MQNLQPAHRAGFFMSRGLAAHFFQGCPQSSISACQMLPQLKVARS